MDRLAREGNPEAISFKRVYLEKDSYDFSFSGLKTAVLNYLNRQKQTGVPICKADVAASFQQAMLDVIVNKTVQAAENLEKDKIVLAGGVAANSKLRAMLEEECAKKKLRLYRPSPVLCTDNGAMIGCAAYYKYQAGQTDRFDMDAYPSLAL